jgi:hypothetical protein
MYTSQLTTIKNGGKMKATIKDLEILLLKIPNTAIVSGLIVVNDLHSKTVYDLTTGYTFDTNADEYRINFDRQINGMQE